MDIAERFIEEPTNISGVKWEITLKETGVIVEVMRVQVACCHLWWDIIEPRRHVYPIIFDCSICGEDVVVPFPTIYVLDDTIREREIKRHMKFREIGQVIKVEEPEAKKGKIVWLEK